MTSADALILDTWAFVEHFFEGPHRASIDTRRQRATRIVTTRDVLVETFAFILRRTKRPGLAREWWRVALESDLVIHEPTLQELDATLQGTNASIGLSIVDISLVWAAQKEQVHEIATADRAFAAVGLVPLYPPV